MSTVALAPPLFGALSGEPTLDQELARVWERLATHAVADCPVCRAEMGPEYGAHARPVGGRCVACGATLT